MFKDAESKVSSYEDILKAIKGIDKNYDWGKFSTLRYSLDYKVDDSKLTIILKIKYEGIETDYVLDEKEEGMCYKKVANKDIFNEIKELKHKSEELIQQEEEVISNLMNIRNMFKHN